MKRALLSLSAFAPFVFAAFLSAQPAAAVPGGEIGTLEQGRYTCELPGDATGSAGLHVPDADFTVISASSYRANGTLGSYLLTGEHVVITNGPHRGQKFARVSRGFLRQVNDDGSDGKLRCVLGRRQSDSRRCPDVPASTDPLLKTIDPQAAAGRKQASCTAGKQPRKAPSRQG